ncbi:serine/arginine repetitive matrix protein 2 isoform X1 [Drosophila nasuta]|uniref:serine/arginine repetitive matrix protein 2 isoform X1 n=1 Tax=Drosophila nasuta TaxID=42062 RepID=UPI00295E2F16|nr:serine/arginine repetitive matrix protein 2 isoform X1 [Drosophila nasuta]
MENIEIEYLDEYKDLVLPGINTNSDTPTTTTASLNNQAGSSASLSRSQGRRISSDTSGSSSIDPDIFQKLFDDKFMEDELLNESSTNVKDRSRHNSSSSSSGSNDALDALFNRQTHKAHGSKRRGRLESFDSLDDLGEVLMGSSHKLLLSKASSSSSRKSQSLHKVTSAVKSKSPDKVLKTYGQSHSASSPPFNARAAGSNINGNSSSSSSSNHQLQDNKTKKPVTIIEAQKPDLKPSKHEPKEDPLHLQDLPCDSDSDSSYVYESDFYGYDDSDEEDDSKQIIDISTDTSATPSVAETVSPVVSDDESQQAPESRQHHERDQQPLTPIGKNERLKVYLDNLSDAETPPSRHKHSRSPTKKSYANEQNQSDSQQVNDSSTGNIGQSMAGGEQQLEVASSSTITNPRRLFDDEGGGGDDSHNLPPADYVDNNLTYETLERLSLNLAEQISSIDAERSIEFEKRSGSKPRSKSISQPTSSSFFVSHVRKLTYSNEALDKAVIGRTNLRRAISEGPFPKGKRGRPPKKRTDTTEEQKSVISLTPKKQSDKNDLDISEGCKNNTHVVEPVSVLESAPEPVLMKASDPVTEPEPTTVTEPILKTITEPVPANVMEPVLPTVLEPVLMTVTEPVEEKLQPSKAVLELTPVKRKPGRPRKKKRIDKSRSKLPVSPELPKHKDAENKIVITNENSNFGKATQEIEILQVDTTDKEKICNSIGSDKNQNSSKTQKTEENLTAAIESITVMENFIRGSEMQTDLKDTNDNSKSEIDAIAKENLENLQETENPMEEVVNILEMATINSVKECDKETGDVQEPIETVTSINEEIKMPEVPEITSKDTINEESSKIIEETEQQVDVGANIELTEENMEKSHEEIELNEMHEADELVKEMAKICEGESLDQIVEEVIIRSEQEVTDDVNQLITPQGNEGNLTEVSNAPEDLGAAELCADNLPTQDIKTASKAIITCEKECSDGSKTITGRRSRSGKRTTKGEINLSAGESPMLTESKDHKFDAENKDTKVDSGDSATEHKRSNSKQKKSETSLKPVTNTTDKQKDNLSRNKKGRFRKRKVEMSEENQLNDFTLDSNNEDIKTVPQTTSATEGQPLNDSQTNIESPEPNSSNENSATENKALQTKRKSKSAKSTSKETKSEDSESNLDVSGKPIPLDLPSTSQEQTTGKTPSENLESIDFQENVASKVTSGKKNRKTLIIKRQPKKADILLSSDRHLGMSQNAAENLKVVNILTDLKFVVENIAESNILPEEKNQISETDELVKNLQGTQVATASDSMMKQLKPKEITDIQESEGRTTRSRAGTPAAAQRFKSREKETAPNTGKEQDKRVQGRKASASRAATKSKDRENNSSKETTTLLVDSQIAKSKTKPRIGPKNRRAAVKESKTPVETATAAQLLDGKATPVNFGSSVASTPSTNSSTNSGRKLRVLMKKSKIMFNLEQQEDNMANRTDNSQAVSEGTSKADKLDAETKEALIATQLEQNLLNNLLQDDIEAMELDEQTTQMQLIDQQLDNNEDMITTQFEDATDEKKLESNVQDALQSEMETTELDQLEMKESEADQIDQSNVTETTGVHDHNDDGVSSTQTDVSQSDVGGSKTKHLMQAKTIMAPPTISHSKVSTGKSVMRRPFNAYEQSTPPAEKRRKVEIKARDKPKSSPATALHQVKGSSFVSPKKVSPVLNTKPEAFTSPSKSTLSSLLGGDETPTLSSSVVITKTTVGTSNEPFKRVASTSPAATSSGINISVSVVPDAITQPKKKLTQAETVKKMLSKAMQSSTVSKGDGKSLPANKPRKSEADKRSIQPVKTVVPLEEKSATLPLLGKKSLPQIETKKKAEKPQRKSMLSKIFDADPLPTEPSTSSQANVAAAAATLTIAKQEKKRPLQKEPKKSVGKAKTKDLEEVRQQLEKATAGPARSTSSPALSPAAVELVKGPAKRMPKKPPQKRDLSVARSLAESSVDRVVTSTSRESSGDRTKRTPRAPKASTISQATSSEPQRQPKKGQKVTTDVTQQALKHQQRLQQLQQEKIQKELQTNRLHLVEQTQPPKKQKQQQQQQQHEKPQGRKRKLPAVSGAEAPIVKRAKQQPEKPSTTSIAFPVRITAASSVSQSVMQPSALQPLPLRAKPIVKLPALRKARRLRVRLNRRVVNNWMKQQQATIEKQLQQMETPSQAIATPATAPVEATHATIAAPPVLPQLLSAASSLPTLPPSLPTVPPSLPALHRQPNLSTNVLPLPLVEVKTEEETVEEQQLQEVIRLLPADRLEAPLQVVAPIPRTVSDPVTPVSSSSIPITMPAHNNDNVVNSSGSVAEVPSASSSTDDVSTFGTTKMFSFLYPSRYKRSYGQVGLDFCCPNLNGPMQAIDPTRLHHKAEVPVLELPQYMVISTKIFSKQDKNIPQKVRAKLEQMAGKEGQPCVVQSVQISEPVAVAAPPVVPSAPPGPVLAPAAVPALAPIATSAPKPAPSPAAASSPASGLIERLTKPLSLSLPRSAILTKKTNPTAAAVAPNLSSSPPVVNTPSTAAVDPLANLLHMPPICPGDKQRVELQTRIQLFDLMLQNITKSVISMTVLERQRVVESFVRKSTLQPIDVEVGTKLLENYGYHLNAIVDNVSVPIPNLRPPVTLASTPAATPQVTSGSKKPSSSAVAAEVVSQPGDPADNYSRAIYDQSRNVIGYEYKKPRHSLVSPSSTPRNPQQQQTPPTAASIKPSAPTAGAGGGPSRVSKRVSSANTVSFQPSSRQKTYSRTANKLQMPQRTLENATPSSTQHAASTNVGASNRNLYIVNQVLSQPEECILPDGVGVPEDAEIKGEIDDVEILA